MLNRKTLLAAALAVPTALLALPAHAQGADPWRFQASVYAYLPTISGSTTFPQNGAGSGVSIVVLTARRDPSATDRSSCRLRA